MEKRVKEKRNETWKNKDKERQRERKKGMLKRAPDMKYSPSRERARSRAARVTLYYYPLSHLPAPLCAAKSLGTINKRPPIVSHCRASCGIRAAEARARCRELYKLLLFPRDRPRVLIGPDVGPN